MSTDHLATVRAEERLLDEVLTAREAARGAAMSAIGIGGTGTVTPWRGALRDAAVGVAPLGALSLLGVVAALPLYGVTVLAPEMARTLGVSVGAVALAHVVGQVAGAAAPLGAAAVVGDRPRRARLAVIAGWVTAVGLVATSVVTNLLGLFLAFVLTGICTGAVAALHEPLLFDALPPSVRVRTMGAYRSAVAVGVAMGAATTGVALRTGATWRGVFLALGGVAVVAAVLSSRLRDPGFGRWDTERIRAATRAQTGGEDAEVRLEGEEGTQPRTISETVRRLSALGSVRRLGLALFVLGMLGVPLLAFTSLYLESRWHITATGRGVFFAATFAAGAAGAVAVGRIGERLLASKPSALLGVAGGMLLAATVLIAVGALSPAFGVMVASFLMAGAAITAVFAVVLAAVLSVVTATDRHVLAGLLAANVGIGGISGVQFLAGIAGHFGLGAALAALVLPGAVAAAVLWAGRDAVDADLVRMVDAVIEDEEMTSLRRSGRRLPMLACRGVSFSYGQLQVLFDVDFTVDDGEMVALLGTNGAGKSTLLKVVSGIGIPSAGTVRYRGEEITYMDAERRVALGITQVPGGRAVFGPMTVVENLRLYAYTLGRDRKSVDRAIETSFSVFPRLYERRSSNAATLSGGEQQMLGLAKALILQPQLLLIDELSLGLAPVIVGQLLDIVRRINAAGTAVVLVEQSVNIALSLVDHAYFMEKGEVRFDGASADLLARGDLLRAVFLEGVGKGTA